MEDNGINGNVDCESPSQEILEGKNISKQPKCHFYDIRQRMWLLIVLVLKNLPEAKVRTFRLMGLAEEISRQPNIEYVMWLLVVTLLQIYNEK